MKLYFEWHRSCIKKGKRTEKLMRLKKAGFWPFFMTMILLAEPWNPSVILAQKPEPLSILQLGTYRKLAPLNPFEVSDTFSTPLMQLVFNRLVRYDAQGQFEPDLAKDWKISEDGKTYTFFLREGVRFHEGTECTAEDALYSLKLAADPVLSPSLSEPLKIIQEMKVISKFSLEIKLREPFAPFLLSLWRVYIIPKKNLSNMPADLQNFLKNPIGTGPFIFSHQNASGIQLKTNLDYFEGQPSLGGVDIRVYSDKDQMWSAEGPSFLIVS